MPEHEERLKRTELTIQRAKLVGVIASSIAAVAAAVVLLVPLLSSRDSANQTPGEAQAAHKADSPVPGNTEATKTQAPSVPTESIEAQTSSEAPKAKNPVAEDLTGEDLAGGDLAGEDPAKKVCPAKTADYPAPYFADTVLIRLPQGVTEDNLIEFTPSFARLSSAVESVSCVKNAPGALISYMAMTFFQDDPAKDLTTLRNETLEVMGYSGSKFSEEHRNDKSRFYQVVIDVPGSADKPDPARALFQLNGANGNMYAIVYETHPNAWNALKETFYTSAGKMSFLAP